MKQHHKYDSQSLKWQESLNELFFSKSLWHRLFTKKKFLQTLLYWVTWSIRMHSSWWYRWCYFILYFLSFIRWIVSNDEPGPSLSATIPYFSYAFVFVTKNSALWSMFWCYHFSGVAFLWQSNEFGFRKIYELCFTCFLKKFQKWSCILEAPIVSFWRFEKSSYGSK